MSTEKGFQKGALMKVLQGVSEYSAGHSSTKEASGKLIATILSTYDLPDDLKPTSVKMHVSEISESVETGPPQSRHKEKNAFKFMNNKKDDTSSSSHGNNNELVIGAPLSQLYPATVQFQVSFDGVSPDLSCEVNLASALCINETQWLILNLLPQSSATSSSLSGSISESGSQTSSSSSSQQQQLQPTLRLKLRLEGEYRSEISALLAAATAYFKTVDHVAGVADSSLRSLTRTLPSQLPAAKFLLVPLVPIATAGVALAPVVLGVLVVGLPFFLPLLVLLSTVVALGLSVLTALYCSTEGGRRRVSESAAPVVVATVLRTPSGQRFVYNTGPRPRPTRLAALLLPHDKPLPKLLVSLCLDLVGSSSYLLPVVGEAFDLVWAPTQTLLVAALYDDTTPALKYVSFVEEILPFTDAVPTATLGWLKEFAPTLSEHSQGVGHDLGVVLRREQAGLKRMGLSGN